MTRPSLEVRVSTSVKPLLTVDEQIEHMRSQGISFDYMSEDEARRFLTECSNYFRLRAYRSCFDRIVGGPRDGNYINLDFAMLRDLSSVDTRLRYEMLQVCIEVEHFSKVTLIKRMMDNGDDPYEVIQDYLNNVPDQKGGGASVIRGIERGLNGPYLHDLVESRENRDYPVWAFVELITFGRFNDLWGWYAAKYSDDAMIKRFYMLRGIQGLRNACAHNNCIINDMKYHPGGEAPGRQTRGLVKQAVSQLGIGESRRRKKLGNPRLSQITTALFVHSKVVSPGMKDDRTVSLHALTERMNRNISYYEKNDLVTSGFGYLQQLINGWYPQTAATSPRPRMGE